MDPHANLKRQRELAEIILGEETWEYSSRLDPEVAARELAELVRALDDWRLNGGFDPYTNTEARR